MNGDGGLPLPLPLGETLLARGLIGADQLQIALMEQARGARPLGKLLVELGFVSEAALRDALGASLGRQSVDLAHATVAPAALRLVPQALARQLRLLPLDYDPERRRLVVAIADPHDIVALDRLRAQTHSDLDIGTVLAGESEILHGIDRHYGHTLSIDGILREIETGVSAARAPDATDDEHGQPVVRLVESLLADAVRREASDIHFEPEEGFLRIRYRIDGVLRQIRALHKSYWAAMAVRLKVMSGMNIAEARAPQDGRLTLNIGGRAIDFRCAALPTIHGENIVLRILDRHKGILPLDRLGLDAEQQDLLKRLMARPEGLILVTGPTGSGKTTTLYSLLSEINAEGVNIMTLEDPVEYPLAMIRQTAVAEAAKLDFANGVRSMMRQDPDVILVGEIRDAATAEMAFRAAMTGHQVYSTLHANSALGALPRLRDIGVPPDIMADNIVGVVAQRLVRKLCPHCRASRPADRREQRLLATPDADPPPLTHRPVGCAMCHHQGYRGRVAIMEILRMDEDLNELVERRAGGRELRAVARAKGLRGLADDGLRRVREGVTSLDELARVVDLTERM